MLTTDKKPFWRVINPKDNNVVTLLNSDGNVIHSDQCAIVLNDIFSRNFSVTRDVPLPNINSCDYLAMFPVIIDPSGVESIIRSLKESSAPGCDLIDPRFLKSTSAYSSIILSKVFQQSLAMVFSLLSGRWGRLFHSTNQVTRIPPLIIDRFRLQPSHAKI